MSSALTSAQTQQLYNHIEASEKVSISGLAGSSYAFLVAALFEQSTKHLLWVLEDKEEAAYMHNDLERLLPNHQVLFYPASYRRPYEIEEVDNANVMMRAEALKWCSHAKQPIVLVSYPDALFEQVLTRQELKKKTLELSIGMEVTIDFVNEVLFEYEFQRVDFVTQPGEFSVRGGILDIFSFDSEVPYRLEFFGDEIDRISMFDVISQLSTESCERVDVLANVEQKISKEQRQPFWSFLPKNTVFLHHGVLHISTVLDRMFEQATQVASAEGEVIEKTAPGALYCQGSRFEDEMSVRVQIDFSGQSKLPHHFQYSCNPQPAFAIVLKGREKGREGGRQPP